MIQIWVPGKSEPGGSKRRVGKWIIDANKNVGGWKQDVKTFASATYNGELMDGAIRVDCVFFILRPMSHYNIRKDGTKTLKKTAPEFPVSKPDATKLFRSTEDALTQVIWTDDARIVTQLVRKRYGTKPGALLRIETQPSERGKEI